MYEVYMNQVESNLPVVVLDNFNYSADIYCFDKLIYLDILPSKADMAVTVQYPKNISFLLFPTP